MSDINNRWEEILEQIGEIDKDILILDKIIKRWGGQDKNGILFSYHIDELKKQRDELAMNYCLKYELYI